MVTRLRVNKKDYSCGHFLNIGKEWSTMSNLISTLKLEKPRTVEYEAKYETDKDKRKFVERTKRIIRSSKEYKDYIKYLKENMDMDKCAFFQRVKHTSDNAIKIEIHHDPFTLDDIVRTVINKQLDEGRKLNDLDIANEVMELHYNDMVGLVPLSETIHELVHSDTSKIFVPLNMIYGNFKKFIEAYQDYMEDDILTRLEYKIERTKNLTEESFNALAVEYEYLDVDGVALPEKVEEAKANVNVA
jgi:hypothetical protein